MNWRTEVEYYERNRLTIQELDRRWYTLTGVPRSLIYQAMFLGVPRDMSVLEVGVGEGLQLVYLYRLGFDRIMGVDVNLGALRRNSWPAAQADLYQLPFPDKSVDVIFTAGTLIYVPGSKEEAALTELARVARHYIAGYEYYSEARREIPWDGRRDYMWAAPWPSLFERYTDFRLARERQLRYIGGEEIDSAYLLGAQA